VLNQAQVGVSLRINFFYRDFYNALQEKNAPVFWEQLRLGLLRLGGDLGDQRSDRDRSRTVGIADPLARMDGGRLRPALAGQRQRITASRSPARPTTRTSASRKTPAPS
jgi:hypothetical protein